MIRDRNNRIECCRRGRSTVLLVTVSSVLLCLASASNCHAQLRIVTYNTTGAPSSGIDIVLKSIGEEVRNGIAKPIDVLLLQEQNRPATIGANAPSTDTQAFVALLNSIYNNAGITYAMSNRTGNTSSTADPTQTLVYRTQTVQLIADTAFGSASQPRQTLRYQLRPVGYSSAADFYVYNSHYKASQDSPAPGTNATQRQAEAAAIRVNSDLLGQGAHVIYAGDHNFYFSDAQEPAWGTLVAAGNGQANDPINQVGAWHNNSSFAAVHTQSPCTSSVGNCGVTGGMDDRFDFQLVTGEFLDGAGLSYISGSYHAFGNNGSTFNDDINVGNTVTFPGVTSYSTTQILNAIHAATDHIPVVADYQLPAVMQAVAGTIPSSIDLGSAFNLGITVNNSANVVASNGADVLTYSLATSGSASGSFLNQTDAALGGVNVHSIALNTSSVGLKSATVTVTSTSQSVQNGTINIPLSFLIVLPGDYNSDGVVDASDYVVWRKNSGLTGGATYAKGDGNRDGNVTHIGQTASGAGSGAEFATTVPEPSSLALVAIGICLLGRRPTRLRAWTPQS
jgi:hypothetical protein